MHGTMNIKNMKWISYWSEKNAAAIPGRVNGQTLNLLSSHCTARLLLYSAKHYKAQPDTLSCFSLSSVLWRRPLLEDSRLGSKLTDRPVQTSTFLTV